MRLEMEVFLGVLIINVASIVVNKIAHFLFDQTDHKVEFALTKG